jgi:hypothetical protein
MHQKTVYAKSAKGREEIATRAHKLGFKPRALLIMIDGGNTVADLNATARHLGDVPAFLAELRDAGFIEPVGIGESAAPVFGAKEAAPMFSLGASPAPTATQLRELSAAKVAAVKFLETKLGTDATDLAMRIEESETHDQFLAHVDTCRGVLARISGEKAADEFWREVVEQFD